MLESEQRRFLVLFGLIFALLILRRPDAVTNPQFWAEDGVIFFTGQMTHPGLAIIEPYKGYLHLVPRLLMAFAALFPAVLMPLVTNVSALAIAALCCALFSLDRYRYVLHSDVLRITLCGLIATAFQSDEIIGNITGMHCFLLIASLLAILQPAEAYPGKSAWAILALGILGALSDPAIVLLLPISVGIAVRHRGLLLVPAVSMVLACVIQVEAFRLVPDPYRVVPDGIAQVMPSTMAAVAYRIVLIPLFGLSNIQSLPPALFAGTVFAVVICLTVWLTSLWWQSKTTPRIAITVSVYLISASVTMALSARAMSHAFFGPAGITDWRGERYFFLGACLFAYLVALTIERWMPEWKRPQVLVLVAVFAGGIFGNFRTVPFPDFQWKRYAVEIDRWRNDRQTARPTPAVVIPINPGGPWKVELPARQ